MSSEAATSPGVTREGAVLHWAPRHANGQQVVLLHGFLDAAGSWDLVAPRLADAGFHVYALDLRGHGEGHRIDPFDYYHFADYLLDVDRLAQRLEGPFVLVGHSMGGMVGTLFAGTFPERVSHFVNVEGLGPPEGETETTPERMRSFVDAVRLVQPAPPASRAALMRRLEVAHPTVAPEVLATRFVHLTRELEDGRFVWRYDPIHRTRGPNPFRVATFLGFARAIPAPVLYVNGGANGYRVTGEEQRLEAFQHLTRIDFEGAGHMVHWTRPAELAAAIEEHAAR